jgi:hypothetical protein
MLVIRYVGMHNFSKLDNEVPSKKKFPHFISENVKNQCLNILMDDLIGLHQKIG